MTTPLPLWHGIVLDQMLVGAAASLVNLIIHAVLLGGGVDRARLGGERQFRPPSCNTPRDRLTGRCMATFRRGDGLGDHLCLGRRGTASIELIYLAFGNYTTLGYADLVAPEQWRLLGR